MTDFKSDLLEGKWHGFTLAMFSGLGCYSLISNTEPRASLAPFAKLTRRIVAHIRQKIILSYSATFQDPATGWTFQRGFIGPERSCHGERTYLHLKELSERNMDNLHTQKLSRYAMNHL